MDVQNLKLVSEWLKAEWPEINQWLHKNKRNGHDITT